ncbi:MAG: thioredoxin family protein [Cyanobacteria bacterium SIG30]|nr:thioredoxin family protein [Cyanobacteria bacterium SIG30]
MKNWIIVLIIFILPVSLYIFLENTREIKTNSAISAPNTAIVYKFMSPMCSECILVQKKIDKIKDNWNHVVFEEINVSGNNSKIKHTKNLIKKYEITMVPTLVFVDNAGNFYKKIEVDMTEEDIEKALSGIASKKEK